MAHRFTGLLHATEIGQRLIDLVRGEQAAHNFEIDSMSVTDPRQAIEAFHAWRRGLLLPGHEVPEQRAAGAEMPDPELVLSSKMLRVFSALHPEYNQHIVELQLHFLEDDYTNRVHPDRWRTLAAAAESVAKSNRDR